MFQKLLLISSLLLASVFIVEATAKDKHTRNAKGGKDVLSVDVPEEMDRNYDDMLNMWATDRNGALDCDYHKETAVLFNDSVYIKRLYALPSQMELAYNNVVKGFIEMYAGRRRGQVSFMLGQSTYYFPLFEEALNREGLPLELKYLPIIESALNPVARSRVGASGLWQFMPATGKMYKLEINSLVDERLDPYKSTQAAVKFLKDMYAVYNDWNLVIAAYNCGPGNVNKAIRRSGGKRDYWDIYPFLPRETRGYVPAFIAATYIMNYHAEHEICPGESSFPLLVDTLGINKQVHLEQIAHVINIPIDDIRKLNPQYKEDIIPGGYKEYALRLPIHNLSAFIDNEDAIYAHRAEELFTHKQIRNIATIGKTSAGGGYATHKIRRGETLGAIAMRYRVSVSQLKKWNNMRSDKLMVGRTLKVSNYIAPTKTQAQKSTSKPEIKQVQASELITDNGVLKRVTKTTKTSKSTYKVQYGDTWRGITNATGASMSDIKKWNKIKGNNLIAGNTINIYKTEVVDELVEVAKPEKQVININTEKIAMAVNNYVDELNIEEPVLTLGLMDEEAMNIDTEEDLSEDNVIYHDVIYGETISQIAAKYNVTVQDILSWNNITSDTNSQITRLLIILPEEDKQEQIASRNSTSKKETTRL